jgi:peptidoglycan hydrolase FlgJ
MIIPLSSSPPRFASDVQLKAVAQTFESAFLAQMLAAAGAGEPSKTHGGIGESQFASLLLDSQAQRIAKCGGIGIAETIIRHFSRDG